MTRCGTAGSAVSGHVTWRDSGAEVALDRQRLQELRRSAAAAQQLGDGADAQAVDDREVETEADVEADAVATVVVLAAVGADLGAAVPDEAAEARREVERAEQRDAPAQVVEQRIAVADRKSTRLNSSH